MNHEVMFMLLAAAMALLAGFFAGSETGIYRLSRLRLRLNVERGKLLSVLLAEIMRDSSGLLLSLLVGTNLCHYVATSVITSLFLDVAPSEHAAELYAALLLAPLLFISSELIPKNVFLHRADALTSFGAPLLYASHKAFTWCGVVPLLRLTSNLFARLIGSPVSSRTMITSSQGYQVRAILRDTQEEGLLSHVQTEMTDRIANIPGLLLGTAMIPLSRVHVVGMQSDRSVLLNEIRRHTFTRLLVWQGAPGNIVGFIHLYDVLAREEEFSSLEKFLSPIRTVEANALVMDTIDLMRREQIEVVLVTHRRGSRDVPVGIVTMKDLVEELMGELSEW
ncbi:MAG: CNNM domain-containing protein [Phycisphaerales bacterium]